MPKFLPLFAVFAVAAAPAAAQTAPVQQQQVEKTKTVTKVVCKRVSADETTGSRLGTAPKVCTKVEVPAEANDRQSGKSHAPSHSGH